MGPMRSWVSSRTFSSDSRQRTAFMFVPAGSSRNSRMPSWPPAPCGSLTEAGAARPSLSVAMTLDDIQKSLAVAGELGLANAADVGHCIHGRGLERGHEMQ